MGTGNEPQRNHAAPKPGKGSSRFDDESNRKAPGGKPNPAASHPGHDPQRFSEKVSDAGQPDLGSKNQSAAGS